LTDRLAAAVIDEALHPVVCAAMARGVEVLNKYYSKTDDSIMYCCAMHTSFYLIILHPRYKTTYFTRQDWPTEWIDNAIALLRAEYEKNYAGTRTTESIVSFCYIINTYYMLSNVFHSQPNVTIAQTIFSKRSTNTDLTTSPI
ncbi:hypothetical protein BD410DRAFT_729280, partial [Rickenella mellea]